MAMHGHSKRVEAWLDQRLSSLCQALEVETDRDHVLRLQGMIKLAREAKAENSKIALEIRRGVAGPAIDIDPPPPHQ